MPFVPVKVSYFLSFYDMFGIIPESIPDGRRGRLAEGMIFCYFRTYTSVALVLSV